MYSIFLHPKGNNLKRKEFTNVIQSFPTCTNESILINVLINFFLLIRSSGISNKKTKNYDKAGISWHCVMHFYDYLLVSVPYIFIVKKFYGDWWKWSTHCCVVISLFKSIVICFDTQQPINDKVPSCYNNSINNKPLSVFFFGNDTFF